VVSIHQYSDATVAAQSTSAARSDLLASVTDYDALNPSEVTDTYGPVHPVVLSDGSTAHARSHTSTTYDEGAPDTTVYQLPTTIVTSAQTTDGIDHDLITKTNGYAAINSGDPSGWSLYAPTSTTTVGAAAGGGNLTKITRYNAAGQTIETRLPGSAGGDARSTVTNYYTATGSGSCVSAALAGLVCSSGPAAQPTTGNPLPVTTYTYDLYDSPLTKVETAGSTVRTTTMTYDAAERPSTSGVSVTPTAAGGTAVPTVTDSYDSGTGLPTTVATSASTLTSTYLHQRPGCSSTCECGTTVMLRLRTWTRRFRFRRAQLTLGDYLVNGVSGGLFSRFRRPGIGRRR
jgi:hypothetical protein